MLIKRYEVCTVTLLVLPLLYARHLPENEKNPTHSQHEISVNSRSARQNSGSNYHNPHHHTSNFLNLLTTHGVGLSADLGVGFRVASGDNHQADHPSHTPKPSTNSEWNRYFGSSWHVGLNTHLANKKDGHEGIAQHAAPGALPFVPPTEEEDGERSDIETTTSAVRDDTFWERLSKYFTWSRSGERKGDENSETDEQVNCDNSNNNVFTRIFTKFFVRENSRNETTENRLLNDTTEQENVFTRMSKYFDHAWKDQTMDPRQITKMKNDFEQFRATIRHYLVDRFTSYVTQNSTNRQFLQKMIKGSLFHALNDTEVDRNARTDKKLIENLSHYFSNEKVKSLFPEAEALRNNIANTNITSENEYNNWFKNNFSNLITKYVLKN